MPKRYQALWKRGLRPGTFATLDGTLTPAEAQRLLALDPALGLRDMMLRIDLAALENAGFELPPVTEVAPKFGMPGGGTEMQFPYLIEPQYVTPVRRW